VVAQWLAQETMRRSAKSTMGLTTKIAGTPQGAVASQKIWLVFKLRNFYGGSSPFVDLGNIINFHPSFVLLILYFHF
jgi:hypothetical protein